MNKVNASKAFLEAITAPMNKKPAPPKVEEEDDLELYDMEQHRIARDARGSL